MTGLPESNKKFEVIAPAGDIQSLAAAVKAGADAIYFGFRGQNARGRAKNFDNEEILKAISYLKEKGIKSYITLNTVITENELPILEKRLHTLSITPPDAIIIQDLAVLELGKQILPETVEFHASTQMGICNLDGLKFAEKCGIKQVVLARELNRKELKKLASKSNVKLEVFVFGAMCYSASGYCYASLLEKNRSGNRGVCAQVCRQRFNNKYPFSMKDLNLLEEIPELVKYGIKHFKVEGRMKGADYVFYAVSSLNQLKYDLSKKGIEKGKEIIKNYPFLRDTGKGYFYFPERKDIFTGKKHSLQIKAGKVQSIKGKELVIQGLAVELKPGMRVKGEKRGATITGIKKNKIILSSKIDALPGQIIFAYPNTEEIKGIKGIVNNIKNSIIPLPVNIFATISNNEFKLNVFFKKKELACIKKHVETERAQSSPLSEKILLKKLKSRFYKIESIRLNKNNLIIKPSVFKEIKAELKEIVEKEKVALMSTKPYIFINYPPLNYMEIEQKKCTILPPVYYSELKNSIKEEDCIVVNNVGQFTFKGRKISGKFIPVCNRVSAYFLKKRFKVKGFQKPFEIEPEENTPYFVVRVKPYKLPEGFKLEKKEGFYLIKKKTQ